MVMGFWRIDDTEVFVQQGDITEVRADAIVNAANSHLWMGAGVAGAIKKKGGRIIEDEAVKLGPIPTGEAVVTTGGVLHCKYIIHAAGMGPDLKTNPEKIRKATTNALRRAEEKGAKSVAFPAIGAGVGKIEPSEVAFVMIDSLYEYARTGTNIQKVMFVLFSEDVYGAFVKELSQRMGEPEGQ